MDVSEVTSESAKETRKIEMMTNEKLVCPLLSEVGEVAVEVVEGEAEEAEEVEEAEGEGEDDRW